MVVLVCFFLMFFWLHLVRHGMYQFEPFLKAACARLDRWFAVQGRTVGRSVGRLCGSSSVCDQVPDSGRSYVGLRVCWD